MGTSVTFDSAVLTEAVSKAVSVAPSKGNAFDKAHGIVIEVMPSEGQVTVRATDLDYFYTEWIDPKEIEGEDVMWRLSANAFGGMVAKLKPGRDVILTQNDQTLEVRSNNLRAMFSLGDTESYPSWDVFEEADLVDVSGIGQAFKNVMWAAADGSDGTLSSVHLTGEIACATDRYKVATFPLKLACAPEGGITLPLSVAKFISGMKGDVKFGWDGHSVLIMPDDNTQIKAIAFGSEYPSAFFERLAKVEHTHQVQVNADELIHMIDLTSVINENDRVKRRITLWIGRSQIAAMTKGDIDQMRDIMPVPGQATHDHRVEIRINPNYLSDALSNGEGLVMIKYSAGIRYTDQSSGTTMSKVLRFERPGEHVAWVAPITGG
ncbi:hypothetical protein AB0F25_30635 [Streptomyces wedmorensis]|uniref:hypothetical protein n=1 Tax=Streptomyces wedmorensis TaxID=43759 RepID=UPI00342755EA